jgi:hypothetical protein
MDGRQVRNRLAQLRGADSSSPSIRVQAKRSPAGAGASVDEHLAVEHSAVG